MSIKKLFNVYIFKKIINVLTCFINTAITVTVISG